MDIEKRRRELPKQKDRSEASEEWALSTVSWSRAKRNVQQTYKGEEVDGKTAGT